MTDNIESPKLKWAMSPTIGKLVEGLAKAQLKFDPVLKDNENPAFRSKYADLATVIESTRKHLAVEGVSVIQMPHAEFGEGDAKILTLTTMLAHSSGEWIATDLSLPAMMRERFDAQSVGSAITYARRYALAAMTCVAQEDDDGNKAAGIGSKEAAQAVATAKIKKAAAGDETVELVPWKDGHLVLRGNGLAIVRANLKPEEKSQFTFTNDFDAKGWTIPESQGNQFASMAEKYKVVVKWVEAAV